MFTSYVYSLEIDGEEVSWTSGKPFPPRLDLVYTDMVDAIKDLMSGDKYDANGHTYEIDDVMVEDEGSVLVEVYGQWFAVDGNFRIVE